jgi:hypothetical protein
MDVSQIIVLICSPKIANNVTDETGPSAESIYPGQSAKLDVAGNRYDVMGNFNDITTNLSAKSRDDYCLFLLILDRGELGVNEE